MVEMRMLSWVCGVIRKGSIKRAPPRNCQGERVWQVFKEVRQMTWSCNKYCIENFWIGKSRPAVHFSGKRKQSEHKWEDNVRKYLNTKNIRNE